MPPPYFTTAEILKDLAKDLAFLGAAIVIVVAYVGRAYRHRKATVLSDGRLNFSPNRRASISGLLLAGWVAWIAIDQWVHAHSTMDFVVASGLVLSMGTFLLEAPGTIFAGPQGLEQSFWFRRNKRILWNEIVEINTGNKGSTITIKNGKGTAIVYSSRLPDRARLLWEIQQHCADELPPEFPGEPMSGPDSVEAS